MNTKRFGCLLWALWLCSSTWAQELSLPVRHYVLLDYETGMVLASKESDQPVPPASITKLMTAYLTFEALERGTLKLSDKLTVSQKARQQKGSRMFVEQNSQVSVSDLLQGLIVQSGNDASVVLAEGIAGSEEAFVKMMNDKAQALGLRHSHFENTTGLPSDKHYMSANDIAKLAYAIITHYPQYFHYYGQKSFQYNNIKQDNRNALLFRNAQVDGLKTGYTDAAGYCLASTEKRGEQRMIAIVLGASKEAERYDSAQALLDYGFAQYQERVLLTAEQVIGQVMVYKGAQDVVAVRPATQLSWKLLKQQQVSATLHADLLVAPIQAGQKVGTIEVRLGNKLLHTLDAVAAHDVEEGNFFKRQWHAIKLWFL
ncbi:MAG: D-alanyl-D-alanine carboxypeptidase family protein [Cardiobacteriaceae bacterium]|nr:D-alanyl-D-alanine carboxypeptidase family protein [Cardiobacteriaceae bacterium]